MRVNENILISSLTTMRLGGPARYVIEIESREEITDAFHFARQANLPTFVLGYGANTIGHDEGYNGVIIINRMQGIESEQDSSRIKILGGTYWDDVVAYTCERGLTGIEGLSKIPGLAGAAPVQNIGAYGQEIANTLIELEAYDSVNDAFVTLKNSDLDFSYRRSILNSTAKNRYFVISITLELKHGEMSRPFYGSIEDYMASHGITDTSPASIRNIVSTIRDIKLPDPVTTPSAGSFFKNIYLSDADAEAAEAKGLPVYRGADGNKINSGWLIEHAGLKGKLLHGIRVSDKAALILINESAKSYQDLARARAEIISTVYDKFGYWLEQEPVEIQ